MSRQAQRCWPWCGTCVARTARLGLLLRWAEVGYCSHEHAMVPFSQYLAGEA
jgi:hypothetical protein